jgi:hypothetical protein
MTSDPYKDPLNRNRNTSDAAIYVAMLVATLLTYKNPQPALRNEERNMRKEKKENHCKLLSIPQPTNPRYATLWILM